MKVEALRPLPTDCAPFRLDQARFVPAVGGCYALTTVENIILYVGLATNIRTRMGQHLENPIKTGLTSMGRARIFHWLHCDDIERVERTWMNLHMEAEGALPILNKAYSPVHI